MRLSILTIFFLLFITFGFTQNKSVVSFSGQKSVDLGPCTESVSNFMSEEDVNNLVTDMLDRIDIKNRFILVSCRKIDNCQATIYRGKPYILYNPDFLDQVKRLSFTSSTIPITTKNWEAITILAHELGHHVNNHLMNPHPDATQRDIEIEADEFAGSMIFRMGGTSDEAAFAYRLMPDVGTYEHPGRKQRIDAVIRGWEKAKSRTIVKNDPRTEPVIVTTNYNSVKIGSQQWMEKNLDVSTYRNGDIIPQVTDAAAWSNLTTGAWCYINNDPKNGAIYGKLYNWYAVNDPRGLAPIAWHIPTDEEWTTLSTKLGGKDVAGGKMKTTGTTRWTTPNTGATNESGFAGLPGGNREPSGAFVDAGNDGGYWWSATEDVTTVLGNRSFYAWLRALHYSHGSIIRFDYDKPSGFSVRCLRD